LESFIFHSVSYDGTFLFKRKVWKENLANSFSCLPCARLFVRTGLLRKHSVVLISDSIKCGIDEHKAQNKLISSSVLLSPTPTKKEEKN